MRECFLSQPPRGDARVRRFAWRCVQVVAVFAVVAQGAFAAEPSRSAGTSPSPRDIRTLHMVTAPYPPFVNPEGSTDGEGMDVEIAREALRREGYGLSMQIVPWNRALHMLELGEADFTTTISKNGDRDRFIAWSDGYRNWVNYRFYARKDSRLHLTSLEGLHGMRLGVTEGFFFPRVITDATGPNGAVVRGNDTKTTVRMLTMGRTDYIVVNNLAGAWEINRLGEAVGLEPQPYTYSSDSPTYMGFSRVRPFAVPLAAMNRGLSSMAKDGSLQKIERKYLTLEASTH